MLKNWYDFHSFIFRGGYFPEIACKYKYLTTQPFFALKKCFCTKSSSLVNKKYIGDSFKHLSIMMQIFNFFEEPIFVICKVANLAYNKYRSIKKMKICFIVAIILKLLPMYFLLTKHEDFVLNHFFSSRIGQVTKY